MARGWRERGAIPAVVLVAAVALAGCGTDGARGGGATAAPEGAGAAGDEFCDAAVRLANPGEPEIDWETATEECGWSEVTVTAVDYGFEGVPETLAPGTTIIAMTNEGDEGHEMILFRRGDGVEESFEEILEMDEDEAMQRVEFTAAAFAPAGETSSAAADLTAGDYAMVCFIPVGSDAFGEPTGDGPPHFAQGMWTSFTVP